MLKIKSKVYPTTQGIAAKVKFKRTQGQPIEVSQAELTGVLLAYRDIILKEYNDFSAVTHIEEAVQLFKKEIGYKEDK